MITKDDINVPALQERAKNILTTPATEWNVIEPEPTTVEALFKGYIAPLAAIPVIANFIGYSIVGFTVPFVGTMRIGIVRGLVSAIVSYCFALAAVYIAGLVVSKLAPTFESRSDDRQALKLVAYAYTPAWIAGILGIIPALGILAVLASLYSIYLFYLGVPVLMKTPPAKVIPYMIVSALVIIVVSFVFAMIAMSISGVAALTTI